jgi:hypothetical protein
MTLIDAARDYHRLGWAPVPISAGLKWATLKDWPNRRLRIESALTNEDIDNYQLLPGFTKATRSRARAFIFEVGREHHEGIEVARDLAVRGYKRDWIWHVRQDSAEAPA